MLSPWTFDLRNRLPAGHRVFDQTQSVMDCVWLEAWCQYWLAQGPPPNTRVMDITYETQAHGRIIDRLGCN